MSRFCYHVLLENPLVAVINNGAEMPAAVQRTLRLADGAIAHLFVNMTWHAPLLLEELASFVTQTTASHPNLRFTIMTATPEDDILYRRSGLDSFWCNHCAFLDGRIFVPDLQAEKLYDAVYVARLVPFKRHELAVDVPRMAVVTGSFEVEPEYASACLSAYRDLKYVNYDTNSGVGVLNALGVNSILNQSRCGLALSAEEGSMFAACEYLLAGLPLVTTRSVGGREVFFDADYVEVVEKETPEAIASAVARMIARDIDAQRIRTKTQQLFLPHRSRLIMRLSGLAQTDLFIHAGPTLWLPQFVNKLKTWVTEE